MSINQDVRNSQAASVAEVALAFPEAIEILNRYGLDFCCHGKQNFAEACRSSNLNTEIIWQEITKTKSAHSKTVQFESWDAELLIEYILQVHHQYIRQAIPTLTELLTKVCAVHGEEQPTLHQIKEIFLSLSDELLDHLPKEEEVLFPALRRLAQQEKAGTKNTDLILQGPISVMEHEHDAAGTLLKELRALTGQYQPPAFACPTYQLAFKLLEEFDRDLVQHIHLENNILFPKATSTH